MLFLLVREINNCIQKDDVFRVVSYVVKNEGNNSIIDEKMKRALITVGTTEFDELLMALDTDAFLDLLIEWQFEQVVIQMGRGIYQFRNLTAERIHSRFRGKIEITICKYVDNFNEFMKKFELIVGHAGAGTLLEVISVINESIEDLPFEEEQKRSRMQYPYVMVVNDTLQGNHQMELGNALHDGDFFILSYPRSVMKEILQSLENPFIANNKINTGSMNILEKFPIYNPDNFRSFLEDI